MPFLLPMDATEPDAMVNLPGYLACIYNHLGDIAPGMAGRWLPEQLNCRGNMAMNLKQSQVGYMGEFEGSQVQNYFG